MTKKGSQIVLLLMSIMIFFGSFYSQFWNFKKHPWFEYFMEDTEAHILGRMVKSQKDGILAAGGLLGIVKPENGNHNKDKQIISVQKVQKDWESILEYVPFQYQAFAEQLPFDEYIVYQSQSGGQGFFFSLINYLLPKKSKSKINLFYALTSLFSAITISIIIIWFYQEFGLTVAIFTLLGTLFSQWLGVFGRNLWWNLWAFYLPMIMVGYYMRSQKIFDKKNSRRLFLIIFSTVFIKYFFNGMEYITTTLIMMIIPFVYYSLKFKYKFSVVTRGLSYAFVASFASILFSLLLLCFQISTITNSFSDGIDHIVFSFLSRTHGNASQMPQDYVGLKSSTFLVLKEYLFGTYYNLENYPIIEKVIPKVFLKLRYLYLFSLFALASIALPVLSRAFKMQGDEQKMKSLVITTWISILAPLSWFIIFKGHSYEHNHMNFIVWQMPFTLFGFAVCGMLIRNLFSVEWKRTIMPGEK